MAVNDLRGMPYISMATQAGACHWACRYCNSRGWHVALLDKVVYPGAAARVMHQWPEHKKTNVHKRLLREWKRRFASMPEVVAQLDTPDWRRDHAFRMQAGQVAEDAKKISAAAHKRAVVAGGYHGLGKCLLCTYGVVYMYSPCAYLDCFSTSRAGFDVGRQNVEDPMHQGANSVKAVFHLVLNIKEGEFTFA